MKEHESTNRKKKPTKEIRQKKIANCYKLSLMIQHCKLSRERLPGLPRGF